MNYDFNTEKGTVSIYDLEVGKNWDNYLLNDKGYVTGITHYGATFSRYLDKNATLINYNNQVSVLYLRDAKTKKYWNIGSYPSVSPVKNYKCIHGQNYSELSSETYGISGKIRYMVSPEDTREMWEVTIENLTDKVRVIDLFASTSFDLGGFPQPFYYNMPTTSATEFLESANGIFCENKNPFCPHKNCSGYIISSMPLTACFLPLLVREYI